ncbi:MAG: translocation/assembly module TamB domain-containing protein [Rhodocyclaceae bacterium]|nr:translocation/assembly module TamB domain-containing protein [Rhodocyclaceae bacterium]
MPEAQDTRQAEAPRKRRHIARRALGWSIGLIVFLILSVTLLAAWVSGTEPGLRTVARLVESSTNGAVRLEGVTGRIFDRLAIDTVRVNLPDLHVEVEGLRFDWSPLRLTDERLQLNELAAQRIRLATRPSEGGGGGLPEQIPLPLTVQVGRLEVGRFVQHGWAEAGFGEPQLEITDAHLVASAGPRRIEIGQLGATLPWGRATANGEIGTAMPYPLTLTANLEGAFEDTAYDVAARAEGDLTEPRVHLSGHGRGVPFDLDTVASPFAPVPLRSARLSAGPIDPSALAEGAPKAALSLEADLRVAAAEAGSTPEPLDWRLEGPLSVTNAEPGSWDAGRLPLEALAGRFRWAQRQLEAEELALSLPAGGKVNGRATWQPVADDPVGLFELALDLAGVRLQALDARLPEAALAGRVAGKGDGVRQTLDARIAGEGLSLDARARHENQVIDVAELRLRQGEATVSGKARVDLKGDQAFSADLVLAALDPARLYADAPQGYLNATLQASGNLAPAPQAAVRYRLAPDSTLMGHALGGEGELVAGQTYVADAHLWLSLADNRLQADGSWGREGDRLALSLEADQLDIVQPELSGRAEVQATLSGTPDVPAGEVLATGTDLRLPGGIRVAGVNLQGRLEGGLDGRVVLVAGVGEVFGADRAILLKRAAVSVDGTRGSHQATVSLVAGEGDSLDAELAGALGEDQVWTGSLQALETDGRVALKLESPASLALGATQARLGEARLSSGGGGSIRLQRTEWAPEGLQLEGSMSGLKVALAPPPEGGVQPIEGQLRLGGEWDVSVADEISGTARIRRESGDLVLLGDATARLGLTELEAIFNADAGEVAVSFSGAGSQLGTVAGTLTTSVERTDSGVRLVPGAPLLGSAHLDMPTIKWLGPLVDANMLTGGRLEADFSLSGSPETPLALGQLKGHDLSLALTDVGLRLSGGTLEASFDHDYLRVVRLEFVSPNRVRPTESRIDVSKLMAEPGRLHASGSIDLATGAGVFGYFADRLPLLQREDRWLAVSGEGHGVSGWDFVDVKARLEADAGAITISEALPPSLSDDVVILGEEREEGTFKVNADIAIRLGKAFYLTAMGLDTRLTGGIDVYVRPGIDPAASGVIRLEDGLFEGYGQKLAVENSTVNFAGPPGNPSLNITALRKGLEVEAGVSITGTARRPRVQLVSSPSVPDSEKLAWIILGRPPDTSSSADLGLLIPAAQALLGGPGGGITGQLSNSLGLDQLSIGQGDLNGASRGATSSVVDTGVRSNAGSVSGQVVTLGKRLSTDTFLAFEQSLAGAESIVKLTHQLGKRLSVVARGGTDNAIDMFYTFTFR